MELGEDVHFHNVKQVFVELFFSYFPDFEKWVQS